MMEDSCLQEGAVMQKVNRDQNERSDAAWQSFIGGRPSGL
jgi:hypothetical protein